MRHSIPYLVQAPYEVPCRLVVASDDRPTQTQHLIERESASKDLVRCSADSPDDVTQPFLNKKVGKRAVA